MGRGGGLCIDLYHIMYCITIVLSIAGTGLGWIVFRPKPKNRAMKERSREAEKSRSRYLEL
jgi:hypothetical protein